MSSPQSLLSCDDLWKQVKSHVTSRHANLANQWKIVDSKDAVCYECNAGAQYSSVLIKCRYEGCTNFYHLDCAHNSKGEFYLDTSDANKLEFDCEEHFVAPKFCLCRAEYDASKAMLLCDGCHEWYHYECIKIPENKAPEQYLCKDCMALSKEGKKASEKVILKNKSKDETSARALDAFKSIDVLTEIVSNVCPLVDSTPPRTPSIWSIEQIDDAIRVASSTVWGDEGKDLNDDLIERFGTESLVAGWRTQLVEARNKMALWMNNGLGKAQQTIRRFDKPALSDSKHAEIVAVMVDLLQFEQNAKEVFHIVEKNAPREENNTPADIKWFVEFCDLAKMLKETLDLLRSGPARSSADMMNAEDADEDADEDWLRELASMVRVNAGKAKARENKSGAVVTEFVKILRSYFSLIDKFVEEMTQAIDSLQQILLGNRSITLGSLLELLGGLDGMPVQPNIAATFRSTVVAHLEKLETDVCSALDIASTDRETVYALKARSEVHRSISIPSHNRLDFVVSRLDFLGDPAVLRLSGGERIAMDTVADLRARLGKWPLSKEFSEDKTSPTSALSRALDTQVAAVDKLIASILAEATAATEQARKVLDGDVGDPAASLAPLRTLKVITLEERALEYLLTSGRLIERVGAMLSRSEQASIVTLGALQGEVRAELESRISNSSRAFKTTTMKLINANEKLNECEKEVSDRWGQVLEAVHQCSQGKAPSAEELQQLLAAAAQLGFTNAEVQGAADRLLAEAARAAENIEKNLPRVTNALQHLPLSLQLMQLVETLPLPSASVQKVRTRHEVCSAVHACAELMSAGVRALPLDEATLLRASALRSSLQLLAVRQSLSSDERAMLASSMRYHAGIFRFEARYALEVNGSEEGARSLLEWGKTLDLSAEEAGILAELQRAVERVNAYKLSASAYLRAFKSTISATNTILADQDSLDGEAKEESFLLAISVFDQSMAGAGDGEVDMACTIRDASFDEELQGASELVRIVRTASAMFTRFNTKLKQDLETEHADNITVPDLEADRLDGITLRDFSAADASLQKCLRRSQGFALLSELAKSISDLHVAACDWNEYALHIVPGGATRTRKKAKSAHDTSSDKTAADVLRAFLQPISRIIMTPSRDVLVGLLQEARDLQSNVESVLFSGSETAVMAPDEDFTDAIESDSMSVQTLLQRVEAMPIHIPSIPLLRWMAQVLNFMKNVPPPLPAGDDSVTISFELAKQFDKQASRIISSIPGDVAQLLVEYGALDSADEEQVSVRSLRGSVMQSLRRSLEYLDYLRVKMADSLALQNRALDLMHADDVRLDALQEVEAALRQEVVQPDSSVFMSIQQKRSKQAKKASRPAKAPSDKMAVDGEPDDDDWDEDSDADDSPEGRSDDRSKGGAKKKAASSASSSSAPAKERNRKEKTGPLCLHPDCSKAIDAPSSYCSDTCCVADSKRLFQALLDGKRRLCAAAVDPTYLPQAKRPYTQFDSDLKAFLLRPYDLAAAYARITLVLEARGLDTLKSAPLCSGGALAAMLRNTHPTGLATNGTAAVNGITAHSVANFRLSLPDAAKELFGADSGTDLRRNIRESFERSFFEALRREKVRGHGAIAAVFAEVVEYELHGQSDNAEQYKRQGLMLVRNLKQKHNDPLILRLVNGETSAESLARMRLDELADAAKQTLRAEAASAVLQGAQLKESVTDTLQKRTQTALLGGEDWRDKLPDSEKDKAVVAAQVHEQEEAIPMQEEGSAPVFHSSSPEKDDPAAQRTAPKRPIDVDLGTRPNPAKRVKPEQSTPTQQQPAGARQFTSLKETLVINTAAPPSADAQAQKPSPRSTPSGGSGLLSMLKSAPKPAPASKYLPLITVHGSGTFALSYVAAKTKETFVLRCTARVLDRRVQGLVDSTVIHGRSKVGDVDSFVREKQGKKGYIIAVLVINVNAEDEAGYRRMCDDYVQSEPQRAGVCRTDAEKITSFNIVPPALKSKVAVLKDVSSVDVSDKDNLLYGILLTKQQGPDNYVNAGVEEMEMLAKK